MARQKKIKLKGSSFFDKNKPINKKRKSNRVAVKEDRFSKKRPLNKVSKTKQTVHKENSRPYSNTNKNNTSSPQIFTTIFSVVLYHEAICFVTKLKPMLLPA